MLRDGDLPTRTALLTGATGYVGGRLARFLIGQGWRIISVGRRDPREGQAFPDRTRLRHVAHEAGRPGLGEKLDALRPDVLFHLAADQAAAQVEALSMPGIRSTLTANILFASEVLDAAWACGCRCVVNAGTQSQHRDGTARYAPNSIYAASKQAFEDLLKAYADLYGMRAVTLKLSDVYGPEDPRRRIIDILFDAQMRGTVIDLSPGRQEVDFIHVDDVVRAFALAGSALLAQQPLAWSYCVQTGRTTTLRDLAALIERIGGRKITARWGARDYRVGTIMQPWHGPLLPRWRAGISLEEGLESLLQHWRRQNEAADAPL